MRLLLKCKFLLIIPYSLKGILELDGADGGLRNGGKDSSVS